MSFNTAQDLAPHAHGTRPATSGIPGKDLNLIDFRTPPGSPSSGRRNTVSNISTALKVSAHKDIFHFGLMMFILKEKIITFLIGS